MRNKIIELLKDIRSDVNFEKEKALVSHGILDSFDIISIVAKLGEEFELDIPVEEINEDNFDSVEVLERMITKLKSN
ncbi:phosphopantetheine-binding protein [Paenibacillus puldeungensis]|uniref:Phosphopantetheine-binding protein n=1 Tax=Paenibacillus puldeungensis TaxID=696536 RepID=A0ABW3S4G1_9BACL